MGFDFRVADPPARWPASYRPQYADAPEYFRVTHKAMHALRAALTCAGVLDADAHLPSFPPWPPPQMEKQRAMGVEMERDYGTSIEPPSTAGEVALLEEWRKKRGSALERTSNDPAKVPAFKFGSNDGWRVHAEEANAIAASLRAAVAGRPDALVAAMHESGSTLSREEALAWVASFADYNALASSHGGYIVS